jgi:hypothetical protein
MRKVTYTVNHDYLTVRTKYDVASGKMNVSLTINRSGPKTSMSGVFNRELFRSLYTAFGARYDANPTESNQAFMDSIKSIMETSVSCEDLIKKLESV